MNWFEPTERSEASVCHGWSKEFLVHHRENLEFGLFGFGFNLCFFQWLHNSCYLMSLQGFSVHNILHCDLYSDFLIPSFFPPIFQFNPWKFKLFGCSPSPVLDNEAGEWIIFCIAGFPPPPPPPLYSALYRFSPHWISSGPFCSTVVFSSSSPSFSLLNTYRLNSAGLNTLTHWQS